MLKLFVFIFKDPAQNPSDANNRQCVPRPRTKGNKPEMRDSKNRRQLTTKIARHSQEVSLEPRCRASSGRSGKGEDGLLLQLGPRCGHVPRDG